MKIDERYAVEARRVIGEDGIALAVGVGELIKTMLEGIDEQWAVRIEVDKTDDRRDTARLTIRRRGQGEADFLVWWLDGELQLMPGSVSPEPLSTAIRRR